jgi:hypothetical protein
MMNYLLCFRKESKPPVGGLASMLHAVYTMVTLVILRSAVDLSVLMMAEQAITALTVDGRPAGGQDVI